MNKKKNLLNNDYAFSFINKMSSVLVGIITSALINRYLGPEGKGQFAFVINIVNLVAIAGNFGFYQSYPKSKRQNMPQIKEKYVDVFFTQFIIYTALAVALSFFMGGNSLYIAALFLVPVQVLTGQFGMVALIEFINYKQKLQLFITFLNLVLTTLVFLFVPSHVLFVMGLLFIKDIIFIVMYLIKIKYIPHPFRVKKTFLSMLFKFGIVAVVSAFMLTLNYKADIIMLKLFVDDVQIGLYSVGVALAEYIWLIPDAFKDVLFARTAKDDAIDEIMASIRVNLLVSAVIIVGMIILGKPFINFMYGAEFMDSYVVTCIIMFGVPSMILYKMTTSLYVANGKQGFYLFTLCVSAVSNIVLNLIFIPFMGKIGAAIASAISYNVCGFVFYGRFMLDYNIKWYDSLFLKKSDIKLILGKIKK